MQSWVLVFLLFEMRGDISFCHLLYPATLSLRDDRHGGVWRDATKWHGTLATDTESHLFAVSGFDGTGFVTFRVDWLRA